MIKDYNRLSKLVMASDLYYRYCVFCVFACMCLLVVLSRIARSVS